MRQTDLAHPPENQLTPKQKILLKNPAVQLLIKTMDCEVQPSLEFKFNQAVNSRVNQILKSIQEEDPKPRKVAKVQDPFSTPDLSNLKPGECPF